MDGQRATELAAANTLTKDALTRIRSTVRISD
jgi:hypothetical protein